MTSTVNVPRELLERAWRALANSATGREIGAYLDADPCAPECAETCARASMCSTCSATLSAPSSANHVEDVRAMVADPSPAGVDGCKCSMSISMLGDGCRHCQPQEYIDRIGEMLDEERSELSDAQAIIDGLRGELAVALKVPSVAAMHTYLDTECAKDNIRLGTERGQQAHRIGELEGLLRSCLPALSDGGCAALANRIAATLSAGKDSAS